MSKSQQSNKEAKKTRLTDTKGKEGSKATEEACRGCRPLDCRAFLSSRYDRRP